MSLAAKNVKGVDGQAIWGHEPFFRVVDRWMTEPDQRAYLEALCGKGMNNNEGATSSTFVKKIYQVYGSIG